MYYQDYENREPESGAYLAPDRTQRQKPKRRSILRRGIAFVLAGAVFGGAAGGAFYGVNTLLTTACAAEAEETVENEEASVNSLSLSYTAETEESLDVTDIAALGLPCVVSVTNISVQEVASYFGQFGHNGRGQTQTQETTSCGSGVIIYASDAGLYIVTNYHVVEEATTLSVTFVDDATYEAQLCGYDEDLDIAVIAVTIAQLSEETLSQISVAEIGNSDTLVVGEQVVAIGNALGYGQSVTVGYVSAVDRTISSDSGSATYIQTDAAINPGNSGGALFNMDGELVGINTAKVSSTDVEGMGYAIPISSILDVIASFITY